MGYPTLGLMSCNSRVKFGSSKINSQNLMFVDQFGRAFPTKLYLFEPFKGGLDLGWESKPWPSAHRVT